MAENTFVKGMVAKMPHERAPDFIIVNLGFKRKELCDWLLAQDGEWINAQVKRSREGKLYVAVDDWKKSESGERKTAPKAAFDDDSGDIPF